MRWETFHSQSLARGPLRPMGSVENERLYLEGIKEAKRRESERDARAWIQAVMGANLLGDGSLHDALALGVVLCKLVCVLSPGIMSQPSEQASPSKQRERIESYLAASKKLGLRDHQLFTPDDLIEGRERGMGFVMDHLILLSYVTKTRPGKPPPPPLTAPPTAPPPQSSPTHGAVEMPPWLAQLGEAKFESHVGYSRAQFAALRPWKQKQLLALHSNARKAARSDNAIGQTSSGANIFGRWAGGTQVPLGGWLGFAGVPHADTLDEKCHQKGLELGGNFLFTHQRDFGWVQYWGPMEVFDETFSGMWPPGGTRIMEFSC